MTEDESIYFQYLLELENEFRFQIKNSYPLFREINIEWKLLDKLPKNTYITVDSSIEKGILIQLEKKSKNIDKKLKM